MAPASSAGTFDSASFVEMAPDGCFLTDASGHYVDVNESGCRLFGATRADILGKTALDFTFPEDADAVRQVVAALRVDDVHRFEWRARRADGSGLDVEVHTRLLPSGGRQSILRDISERKQREHRQAQDRSALERLHAISTLDLSGQADTVLLDAILDAAIAATEADVGCIQILDPVTAELCIVAQRGFTADWLAFWSRVPAAQSGYGPALAKNERVIIADIEQSEPFAGTEVLAVQRRAGVRAMQSTPLVSRTGELRGIISTHYKTARQPAAHALEILDVLSRHAVDILERRRLKQRVLDAEALSSGILAASGDAIISVDSQLRIIRWNASAETLFGYTQEEALSLTLDALVPAGQRAAHREHVRRFAAESSHGRRMDHAGALGRRKSGAEFPIEATISHLVLDGAVIMTVAVRDVTEQRRSENEQNLLAELGGALVSLDYGDTLQQIVKIATARLADYAALFVIEGPENQLSRAAVATRDPGLLWTADLIMSLPKQLPQEHPIVQVVAMQRPILFQLEPEQYPAAAQSPEHLRALQAASPRSVIMVPLMVGSRCLGALGISRTERFDARDLPLAEEVARRCALYLENAQLHRAEKRATRARDDVLAIVAHDLRNPLNSIALQMQLLLRRRADADGRWVDPVQRIHSSVARMNQLIQDLLDVARLEAGELSMKLTPLAPEQILAEVMEAQQPLAAAAQIELRCEPAAGLPAVRADQGRLLQVFQNLISNALKFTPTGGQITIGAAARKDLVEFHVSDTGQGIPAAHLTHLFDRYWQADRADRRGIGLGLSIVQGIVQAHGGRVSVQSTPGGGSRFAFTIPTLTALAG